MGEGEYVSYLKMLYLFHDFHVYVFSCENTTSLFGGITHFGLKSVVEDLSSDDREKFTDREIGLYVVEIGYGVVL